MLVCEEVYGRMRQVLDGESQFVPDMTRHVMEIFGREGWEDPSMDIYNELDPRGI